MILFFKQITITITLAALLDNADCRVKLINDDSLHTFNYITMKYRAGA